VNSIIKKKLSELKAICAKHHVHRLALFGSAASESFNPTHSDIDLIVEFQQMAPVRHADCYFSLMEDMEQLLGFSVDLVEYKPIRNPYFKRAVEQSQVVIYEAA